MGKTVLFVAGMHRSGTSALARVMNLRGGFMPEDVLAPQPDNPTGFWEPREAVQLNDGVLEDLQLTWDDPKPLLPSLWAEVLRGKRTEEIKAWLAGQMDEAGDRPLVLKDPRMGRTLPVWLAAVRDLGFDPVFGHILRNPIEVGESLKARNQMSHAVWQHLWLVHILEIERAIGLLPAMRLTYSALLEDPVGATTPLAGLCDLPEETDAATAGECRGFVDKGIRHHAVTDAALERARNVGPLVKQAWALLSKPAREERDRSRIDRLYDALLVAWDTMRPTWRRQDTAEAARAASSLLTAPAASGPETDKKMRKIVLHYHLFKNAGTSVDQLLRASYGSGWVEMEAPDNDRWGAEEIGAFLQANPNIRALSSHTALLPVPRLDDAEILPVLFLRDPIKRAISVYQFEHQQNADTEGARAAKRYTLAEYIQWRLERPTDRAIRNFQTYRLGMTGPSDDREELTRAVDTLLSLPFVGLVEDFNASIRRLAALGAIDAGLAEDLPHANRSDRPEPPDDEVVALLQEANRDDLMLYEFAKHYHRIKAGAGA